MDLGPKRWLNNIHYYAIRWRKNWNGKKNSITFDFQLNTLSHTLHSLQNSKLTNKTSLFFPNFIACARSKTKDKDRTKVLFTIFRWHLCKKCKQVSVLISLFKLILGNFGFFTTYYKVFTSSNGWRNGWINF